MMKPVLQNLATRELFSSEDVSVSIQPSIPFSITWHLLLFKPDNFGLLNIAGLTRTTPSILERIIRSSHSYSRILLNPPVLVYPCNVVIMGSWRTLAGMAPRRILPL